MVKEFPPPPPTVLNVCAFLTTFKTHRKTILLYISLDEKTYSGFLKSAVSNKMLSTEQRDPPRRVYNTHKLYSSGGLASMGGGGVFGFDWIICGILNDQVSSRGCYMYIVYVAREQRRGRWMIYKGRRRLKG